MSEVRRSAGQHSPARVRRLSAPHRLPPQHAEQLRRIEEAEHRKRLAEAVDKLEAETKRNRFFTLALDMLGIGTFEGRLLQVGGWLQAHHREWRQLPVRGVCLGFHLGPAPADYLTQVVAEIKKLEPDVLIPMHCSGLNFLLEARQQMPGSVVNTSTGSKLIFSA